MPKSINSTILQCVINRSIRLYHINCSASNHHYSYSYTLRYYHTYRNNYIHHSIVFYWFTMQRYYSILTTIVKKEKIVLIGKFFTLHRSPNCSHRSTMLRICRLATHKISSIIYDFLVGKGLRIADKIVLNGNFCTLLRTPNSSHRSTMLRICRLALHKKLNALTNPNQPSPYSRSLHSCRR